MYRLRAVTLAVTTLATSCRLFGGVQLTEISTTSSRPSQVASLVAVTDSGRPVADLQSGAFRLYEEDQPLNEQAADLRLIDTSRVVDFHTVLLVELGQETSDDLQRAMSLAVSAFVRQVRSRQSVTVLGYDGLPKPRPVGDYPADATAAEVPRLDPRQLASTDRSRDLRGAVIQALDLLDARLARSQKPWRIGTLVVFTRGPDVAGRVAAAKFDERLSHARHRLMLIDVAGAPSDGQVERLAVDGRVDAAVTEPLSVAFEKSAAQLNAITNNHYLISYCSPARAGTRRLRVEVQLVRDDLEVDKGSFETKFDATGFSAGCNSANPPRFARAKSE